MKSKHRFLFVGMMLTILLLVQSYALALPANDQGAQRAFSLNELQKRLKTVNSPEISKLLSLFCGITVVDGYILDKKNHDIVLFGRVDTRLPFMHTEDFVVALRNAWMKYAEFKDNTWYYSFPGCSIDPDPQVLGQLNTQTNELMKNQDIQAIDDQIGKWHDICAQPQTVRVLGIPFETHFGDVMVEADYLMKRLVDGSVEPAVDGFSSLMNLTKTKLEQAVIAGKTLNLGICSMNRFWFYPGENQYTYNDNTVSLSQCPITLLTESQYLHSSGKSLVGTGKTDSLAQEFASRFTLLYGDIAEKEPIYYELEALFRLVALAKVMNYNEIDKTVKLDYWLENFSVAEIKVAPTKKGLSRIEQFEHRRELEDSIEIIKLWLPTCGGVGIEIEANEQNMVRDTEGKLQELEEKILQSRPAEDALFWDVN
ncbi:MAG TPA: DUF1598 domain-containing protein [bacterium]|nr:DUF1598 domain-containing protein [bacterium]HPN41984.1 DUF1598 domain-containing protein [bacterium]